MLITSYDSICHLKGKERMIWNWWHSISKIDEIIISYESMSLIFKIEVNLLFQRFFLRRTIPMTAYYEKPSRSYTLIKVSKVALHRVLISLTFTLRQCPTKCFCNWMPILRPYRSDSVYSIVLSNAVSKWPIYYRPHCREIMYLVVSVCLSVCLLGCTQGTLYTTTTVYGVRVHQEGAICTIKAQYAPRCTRETMFFEKFRWPWMNFCTYMYLNGSHGGFIGSQVFEWVTLLQLFLGSQWIFVPTCIWMGHMVDL